MADLCDKFLLKDRWLYEIYLKGVNAAIYEISAVGTGHIVAFDVFSFNNLAPLEEHPYNLYPSDEDFSFKQGATTLFLSVDRANRKEQMDKALLLFKKWEYHA